MGHPGAHTTFPYVADIFLRSDKHLVLAQNMVSQMNSRRTETRVRFPISSCLGRYPKVDEEKIKGATEVFENLEILTLSPGIDISYALNAFRSSQQCRYPQTTRRARCGYHRRYPTVRSDDSTNVTVLLVWEVIMFAVLTSDLSSRKFPEDRRLHKLLVNSLILISFDIS